MRTTLTLEDDVAKLLQTVLRRRKRSLKAVVNEALRSGLADMVRPEAKTTRFETAGLQSGPCLLGNLDNVAEVLELAEDPPRL